MQKSIALFKKGFQSSCYKTPEFKTFARTFRNELKKELEKAKCCKIEFSTGHFYISGFFTTSENIPFYFSISDVRFFRNPFQLMYREVKNYSDYAGKTNRYIDIATGMVDKMNLKPYFQEV